MGAVFGRDKINTTGNLNNDHAVDGFGIAPPQISMRLLSELRILTENADVQSYFRFESSEQHAGRFYIDGYLLPRTEPYNHGEFKVRIILSEWYPFQSPELQLLTPLYHLNVKADVSNLEFCCTCCSFKIGCTEHICNIIKCYVNLIDRPDCRCTCNSEARILYHENRALYEARASEMVAKYAYPRQMNS